MINLLIALLATLATAAGIYLPTQNHWYAMIGGLVVFAIAYLLLSRWIFQKIGALMQSAQGNVMGRRTELAISTLETGFKYGKWQFFVTSQINSQIGSIYYMVREFGKAFPYLEKGFVRHWVATTMLAICYMKRQKTKDMISTFEKATSVGSKEPIVWGLYAYCLEKIGDKKKAIAVLKKGLKKTGNDSTLQNCLNALESGQKMKVKEFGEGWDQFHLQSQGELVKKQTKMMQGRRKTVRR